MSTATTTTSTTPTTMATTSTTSIATSTETIKAMTSTRAISSTSMLSSSNTIKNGSDLCTLLRNYSQAIQYLQMHPVQSPVLARETLACVWPFALSVSSQTDVNQWFNVYLAHYLPYLSYQLIRPAQLNSASCLSYRKLVSVLGNNYNFSNTDFTSADVYKSIKAYLTNSSGTPRCYNSSDPNLNSTAWFTNNIGPFITFMSLSDLQTFVSDSQISVFAVNPDNLRLFSTPGIAANVTAHYMARLFATNPKFDPLSLPANLLCATPASAFVNLLEPESKSILKVLNNSCTTISLEVTAALVANFNSTLTTDTIQSLGTHNIGLTEGQILAANPNVITSSISSLSTVTGWNQGQVNDIIQRVTTAGFQINSASSLVTLGTLIGGVSTATMSSIPSSQLQIVSQNPTFVNNILTAPVILQETYVRKIVSLNESQAVVNIPNELATFIPRVILASLNAVNVSFVNPKNWNKEQALVLFPDVVSVSNNVKELSDAVLQGFSCTSAQALPVPKIKQVVQACRPQPGKSKVPLQESQLTCMYNYVKDTSITFSDVPSDMLLYYNYSNVQDCRSYFSALGAADFSIPSSFLNIQKNLFNNAQTCLGISGFSLSQTQVGILGNMICTIDSFYIKNSDPLIIEKLKNCGDLTASQVTGIQTLLFSGNTPYGNPSTWKLQTLQQLGNLPLYLNTEFWAKFSSMDKMTFLRSFIPTLKTQNIPITTLQRLFTASNTNIKSKRAAGCTAGEITEANIADPSFPVGYDSTQFDLCLSLTVLKNNPAAITQKVVDPSFERIILNKLNQAYPSGLNDSMLQKLGPTSHVATVSEISNWTITTIDTLASLMNPVNGAWTSDQSTAVIINYLSVPGNTLGTAEINAVGSSLCSLNISVLRTITVNSLKFANPADLSSCSFSQKNILYNIAVIAFINETRDVQQYYQLICPFLGGAPLSDIITLAAQNISMDITTFINLDLNAVMALNVSAVNDLFRNNLPVLKLFENNTVVQSWRLQQYQFQLDTLRIGLIGIQNPSTANTTPTVNKISMNTTTTITKTSVLTTFTNYTANTTAGCATVHGEAGLWRLSLFVGLLTVTLHTVH
ncbi:mesothelin-like protein [Brachyhypopomus gauderio]|uniref:mesothelin-like protein n=1 Tax=Brachyhypopomus gauderio TaxID=698409 RepID=UPI004040F205